MLQPTTLSDFYILTVGIAGFLLPVFQAVLLFVTEKSFNRLEATRQELIGFYRKQGAVVSVCLVFLILEPIFLMLELWALAKIFLILFVVIASVVRVILLHDTGVWATMFSTKFIPRGNRVYRFIRACRNNDAPQLLNACFFALVLVLPFFFEQTMAVAVLAVLVYSVITIAALLNNPTEIQQSLLRTENTGYELGDEENRWNDDKVKSETRTITAHFKTSKFYTQDTRKDDSGLFTYNTNWFIKDDNGEFFCNIWISELYISSIDEFKSRINHIVKEQMVSLLTAKTDVNSFVFSFHFKMSDQQRNAFFRSNKSEIETLKLKDSDLFVKGLKNKLYDEVLL